MTANLRQIRIILFYKNDGACKCSQDTSDRLWGDYWCKQTIALVETGTWMMLSCEIPEFYPFFEGLCYSKGCIKTLLLCGDRACKLLLFDCLHLMVPDGSFFIPSMEFCSGIQFVTFYQRSCRPDRPTSLFRPSFWRSTHIHLVYTPSAGRY